MFEGVPASLGTLPDEEDGTQLQAIESVRGLEETVQQFVGLLEQMKNSGMCDLPMPGHSVGADPLILVDGGADYPVAGGR